MTRQAYEWTLTANGRTFTAIWQPLWDDWLVCEVGPGGARLSGPVTLGSPREFLAWVAQQAGPGHIHQETRCEP